MNPIAALRKLRKSIRERGLRPTLWLLRTRLSRRIFPNHVPHHPFDRAHGTDTGGLIDGRLLHTGQPNDSHSTAYWGIAPSLLYGSLAQWQQTLAGNPSSASDYTFLDLGCGKGRALMLASETPFARVLGVEINPVLAGVAHRNLARWLRRPHPCQRIDVLHGDALEVPLPDTPVLIYLFNPFDAALIQQLALRIKALGRTRTHPIDILYVRPDHAALFEAVPGMKSLSRLTIPFTPEETAADIFNETREECFLYRLPPGIH